MAALGSSIDDAILRLGTTYDVRGLVEKRTSYNHATVGSGSVVNEVQNAYNDFGQLETQYQEHSGAVNTGTSVKVEYGYEDGSANTIRPTELVYPSGWTLTNSSGTADSDSDRLSRVEALLGDDDSPLIRHFVSPSPHALRLRGEGKLVSRVR